MAVQQQHDAPRVGAYVRVSRIGGRSGEGYITVAQQRERCQQFAEFIGATIVEWFEDQDFSGGNTERPAFMDLIETIERRELDGMIVVRIDRFSRNVEDGAEMIRRITEAGGTFGSATEHLDVRDPVGRFVAISMLNNAELQLNMLKRGWSDAKQRAVRRGVHIGPTPFGYIRVPKTAMGAKEIGLPEAMWEKSGMLVPDPETAPLVLRCFEMRLGDARYTEIGDYLQSVRPRADHYQPSWVKQLLQRRVYLGEVHYKSQVEGVADLVNLNAHEPIVPRAVFNSVRETILSGEQRTSEESFLLAKMIRCACCRYSMGGFSKGGTKRDTPVYRCISRGGRCSARPVITAARIEEHVIDLFWQHYEATYEIQEVAIEDDFDELERRLGEARDDEDAFYLDTAGRRRLGEERWARYAEQYTATREQRESELADARRRQHEREVKAVAVNRETVNREQLRDLLRGAIESVWVRPGHGKIGDRVKVTWRTGPERQYAVPTRAVSGPFEPIDWDQD